MMATDKMREFTSGAIRDKDENKLQFSRCLSPIVLIRFVEFLRGHNKTAGGKRREDNWKKGFDRESYIESKFRHFVESWLIQDGLKDYSDIDEFPENINNIDDFALEELIVSLCAELFNTQGFLHMLLLEQRERKAKKIVDTRSDTQKKKDQEYFEKSLKRIKERKKKPAKKKKVKMIRNEVYTAGKAVHYLPNTRKKAMCGKTAGIMTANKKLVTCKTCKKILKLWELK